MNDVSFAGIRPRQLLWIDGSGGALVGVLVLALHGWLSELHRMPTGFVVMLGAVNLAYGTYSLSLASRARRPMAMIVFLVIANATWMVLCFYWTLSHWQTWSLFGILHVAGEGLYVGGLAALEWRWRGLMLERD